jgi:hypothetical protein
MEFIKDSIFQFILNLCVAIFFGLVSIWLARRRPVLALSYETLKIEQVNRTEQEIELIKKQMEVSLPATLPAGEYFIVTAKIVNFGKESIKLPSDTPLTIEFEKDTNVIGIGNLEKSYDPIEVTPKIDAMKAKLILPLLDPKESITFKMLLDRKVGYFPKDVYARIGGKKRIVKANNVKAARENKIFGFIILGLVALLWLLLFSPFGLQVYLNNEIIENYKLHITAMLFGGIVLILTSWEIRRMPPNDQLVPLSKWLSMTLKEFLVVIPFFILICLVGVGIFALFGIKGLAILLITFVFILMPLVFWYFVNYAIVESRKKRGKPFNPRQIVFLTGIFPVTIVIIGIYLIVSTLLN